MRDPIKKIEAHKRWRNKHKKEIAERCRKYRDLHRDELKKYMREYYKNNKDELKKQKHQYYQQHKEECLARSLEHYNRNKEHYRKQHKIYHKKRKEVHKLQVLTYYGNGTCACVLCGFDDIRALSIDHIYGKGSQHRKNIKKQGINFYSWLIKSDYPEGYRTLCMNCQFIDRDKLFTTSETKSL